MNKAGVFAAKARGYMQGAQKIEKAGDFLAAREYYLKAAEAFLAAYRVSNDLSQKAVWKKYAVFLIRRANSLKNSPRVSNQRNDEFRQAEVEQLILSERPNVRFDDVVALDEAKERIKESVIYPFTHPEMYRHYNVKPPKGVLLYGPPGCGKTYVAKAAATESNAAFISASISDIMDKFVGESEKRIREIFNLARRKGRTIIFLDEIDAVATSRSRTREGHERRLVGEILNQLDGLHAQNDRLFVLGATNRPWDIDFALLRAGRFSTSIFIPHPELREREALFKLYLQTRPTARINYEELARRTVGFEASRIAEVCDEAGLLLIRENISRGGGGTRRAITMEDLYRAIEIKKKDLILPAWYAQSLRELHERRQIEQFPELVKAAQKVLGWFNKGGEHEVL